MTQPAFPPNPYAAAPMAPPAPAYAPHPGAPMQPPQPAPLQYSAQQPAQQPAPVYVPQQQYTGLGPSGYGAAPPAAAYPPPGYPMSQYAPQPGYVPQPPAGYVPPVNWDNPKIYQYQNQTPFVPFVPNDYVMQLLHLRYAEGKYHADVRCESAAHQQGITDPGTGMPLAPCAVGGEYSLYFDFTKTGKQQWMTERAQTNLQVMIGACTRETMTPALIQQRLGEFMSKSRDELTALGFRFRLVLSPDPGKDGKVYTKFAFMAVQA